jgi:uncharacterized protein with HEPN domain
LFVRRLKKKSIKRKFYYLINLKSDLPYLKLINESIVKIFEYLNGCTEDEFYNDDQKKDACLTRSIVIGEYGSKISEPLTTKFSGIE